MKKFSVILEKNITTIQSVIIIIKQLAGLNIYNSYVQGVEGKIYYNIILEYYYIILLQCNTLH